jgi:hypothetical protein
MTNEPLAPASTLGYPNEVAILHFCDLCFSENPGKESCPSLSLTRSRSDEELTALTGSEEKK